MDVRTDTFLIFFLASWPETFNRFMLTKFKAEKKTMIVVRFHVLVAKGPQCYYQDRKKVPINRPFSHL